MHDALVILGAAGIVIPAFARLKINPVIGYLLVGLIAGPSALGALASDYPWLSPFTISDREAIEPFAELGIILLLFGIGLELSFRRLVAMRKMVFGMPLLWINRSISPFVFNKGWITSGSAFIRLT